MTQLTHPYCLVTSWNVVATANTSNDYGPKSKAMASREVSAISDVCCICMARDNASIIRAGISQLTLIHCTIELTNSGGIYNGMVVVILLCCSCSSNLGIRWMMSL